MIITAADNIKAAVAAVDEDNMDSYLDLLTKYIDRLFKIKEGKNPSQVEKFLPSAETVKNFKDFFSEGINAVKDCFKDYTAKELAHRLLVGVGTAHSALAGLVVLANILEMFETRSANKKESLRLMNQIRRLANNITSIREYPQLKQAMENEIREATVLIAEGSILCCTKMKSPGLFSAKAKKDELVTFKQELENMEIYIFRRITIRSVIHHIPGRPFNGSHHPVEMEKQIDEVTDLLKGEPEETALAVILHGHGGMGKSTLGNAVYAVCSKLSKSFKYSKVELSEDQDKSRTILDAQKMILGDLGGTEMISQIRTKLDGQNLLRHTLKEVAAFIFIDNTANLSENELSELLPRDLTEAKNVRLLLTARNTTIRGPWSVKKLPKIHKMSYLSFEEAMSLLKTDTEGGINDGQFTNIIGRCDGIPMMLTLVGGFIRSASEKLEAYSQFMDDKYFKTEPFDEIAYLFAFDHLPCDLREPFLDICFFFRGWDWNTVEGIVGKPELVSLEARALLTKDSKGVVSVHNVILSLVQKKETETRFKLTHAGQMKELLPKKDIKGIWVESENTDLFPILDTKLNSMYKSLRVLKLGNSTGAVPRHLPSELKMCEELKYLSYQPTGESEMLPRNLTYIEFDGSSNKHDFRISFENHHKPNKLRILKFIQFPNLRTLPDRLVDAVTGLQELTLSKCESIKELPQSITKLQSLKKLNLHGCKNLERLPRGFEQLSILTLLDLSFCEKLLKLPHRIGYIKTLSNLSCNNCSSLTRFPESIGMNSFTMLDMSGCSSLRELPSLFVSLEKLISLNLSDCSSLEKLPQGFGQLKCLVKLNLSKCSTLKQLCYDFHCLSSLEMLDLSQCEQLGELPQNFDRLPVLKHLYLSFCYKLEGKSMDSLEKMETLQIINIKGSSLLKKRWQEIQTSGNKSCSFAVYMEDLRSTEEKENILQTLLSKLDHFLMDKQGNLFKISSLPIDTTSLFMFHSDPDHDFPFPLIEEAIDDNQNGLDFKMFYIGKHFNKLHSKVKDNISGYSDDILEFGESWLSTLDANVRESWLKSYNAEEPIYLKRENGGWTVMSKRKLEEFVLGHCERYKKLVEYSSKEPSEESNLYLLRELFGTREEEEDIFLTKYASGKDPAEPFIRRVDELKGKTILLEMGCEDLCDDIGCSVLAKMYLSEKDRLDLEIISIPMVDSKIKVKERFSKKVPWLVLRHPWVARAARYFLVADCGWKGDHLWYGSMFWIIEPDGTISICTPFMLFMLNMWKPKISSSPQKIFEELARKEWNRLNTVSNLEFLFSHLENVSNQVKGIRKLICIYNGNEVTCSLRNASTELKDSIHIIYIPRYAHKKEMSRFTDSIYNNYNSWEKPKMQLEVERAGMQNLSEDDSMRFWMRILFLKEEIEKRENIKGIDNNGKMQVQQMETLLHPFLLMEKEQSVVFMDEDGKMIATCRGDVMEWIFKEDGEDRAKRLIKRLVKVSKVEREPSIAVSTNIMQAVPVAVQQENVNDLDNLSQYTSDLLEMVQLYQLLNFNKEGSESATLNAARPNWPGSIGFPSLNNFPYNDTSMIVENINSEHPQGDILEILLERLVQEVPDEELAAAGVLVVADILERFKNVSANRNECLILLEEMNRLSQYIKDLNGQPEKKRRATKWLVHCYIMCCAQIETSQFATFFKWSVNDRKVLIGLQQWLRRSQEELRK